VIRGIGWSPSVVSEESQLIEDIRFKVHLVNADTPASAQNLIPWAQGVGRSNRPAPTDFFNNFPRFLRFTHCDVHPNVHVDSICSLIAPRLSTWSGRVPVNG